MPKVGKTVLDFGFWISGKVDNKRYLMSNIA